jgi:hypothetical protein
MPIRSATLVSLFALAGAAAAPGAEVPETWPVYDRDREVALALSAAPLHLRAEAGVYALVGTDFERVRESRNGFDCVVQRVGRIQAPQCFDREGAETTLPAVLREMRLQLDGRSRDDAREVVAAEYRAGKLVAPRRPGLVYMLSREFLAFGEQGARRVFEPHLMFYAPNLTNADVGALPEHHNDPAFPFVLDEGKPSAYVIVVPPDIDALIGPEPGS